MNFINKNILFNNVSKKFLQISFDIYDNDKCACFLYLGGPLLSKQENCSRISISMEEEELKRKPLKLVIIDSFGARGEISIYKEEVLCKPLQVESQDWESF